MSTRGKITLAACALGFLAVAVLIVKMAGAPSYTTVMTGVDPSKTSQITAALTTAGVPFELQNGGTAVAVQKGKETAANVALATKGLNSGTTQPGFEILDKQKLGASSEQQQIAYQRGLEGAVANTISQIQGGGGAQVHLTLAQDNLFASDSQPATAAVLLPQDSSTMDPGSVRGIANLVASSVPGLKPGAVTITDATGAMLWPASGGGTSDGTLSKSAAELQKDQQVESALNAMLLNTLGPNKAQVQVNADLNMDKVDQQQLTYGKDGVPLTNKTTVESLKGTGAVSGGTAGTAGNLPTYSANATGGSGNNNYKNTTTDQTLGVNKLITKKTVAPGAINRMDVAVILDKSVNLKPPQLAALKSSIAAAAGLQVKGRGDTLAVTSGLAFAKVPAAATKSGPIPPAFAGILKGLGIGLGALFFLFFVTRHLRRRERAELVDEPSWLKALEEKQSRQLMPMPDFAPDAEAAEVVIANSDPRRQHLDNVIHDEPERVAAHLRTWITEDNK